LPECCCNDGDVDNVLTTGTSKLAVVYHPSEDVDADDPKYIPSFPCQFCNGYFSSWQLWHHAKKCRCKPVGVQPRLLPVAAGHLLLPCKSDDSVAQLLSGMKKGPEFTVVNGDWGIQCLAAKLLSRVGQASTTRITSVLDCERLYGKLGYFIFYGLLRCVISFMATPRLGCDVTCLGFR